MRYIRNLMLLAAIAAAGVALKDAAAQRSAIGEVRVEGTQRIEVETVRSYSKLRAGDSPTDRDLDEALKSLFATGLFSDVSIRREGADVVVRVVENPIINRLAFEGNKRITDEILTDEVKLRPRVVFTRARVQADAQRIMEIYRRSGRFAVIVEPKVVRLPQNRVDLIFEIEEGDLTTIRKISFIGNERFSDGDLREVIQTTESAWYRFLTSNDTYDPDRLAFDRELLRRHYLANGYADFRVVSSAAELTPDNKEFFVTFTVNEGPRYKFGEIGLETEFKDLDADQLRSELTVAEGDWYDADKLEKSIGNLTDAVGVLGYAFVEIVPNVNRDREARAIAVTFAVEEGPRVFVERVRITGNVRTTDEVIRREMLLVEGDAFNTSKLRRSLRRIRNLGFFEDVNIENEPGSAEDRTIISVAVKEQATGEISFGAGYSTASGVLGEIGVRERNLLGTAQDLRLNLRFGTKEREGELSYTEPYFMDRELSAGIDIFSTQRDLQDESSYDREATGFALRMGYRITEPLSQTWKYVLREDEVTDIRADASLAIQEERGAFVTSALSQTLLYDLRDNRFNPTEGYFLQMDNAVAGIGGDSRYLRNRWDSAFYLPVAENWIVNLDAGAGYVFELGEDIRIVDRFFLGGGSLRGFEPAGVGPRDRATDDALGGEWFYRLSAGLSLPLGLPNEFGVKGRVFTDAGSVGGNDKAGDTDDGSLRSSIGVGLSWLSPIGPVNIDISRVVRKEEYDQTQSFRFSFGTRF